MTTQHKEMLKRLNGMAENIAISMSGKNNGIKTTKKWFKSSHEHYIEQLKKTIVKELEPFLISEKDLAVANREKEIVELLKKHEDEINFDEWEVGEIIELILKNK